MSVLKSLGVALVAATLSSSVFAVGPYAPGEMGTLSTASFGNTVSGAFSDVYSFSVVGNSAMIGASVTNISFEFDDQVVNQIANLSATLDGQSLTFTSITESSGGEATMGYVKMLLEPGAHHLTVNGEVVHSGQASYAGNIAVATIPEPETYALMMAGLGVVGWMARRRKAA